MTVSERGKRIWELDALRGICVVGMVIIHFIYDLNTFSGIYLTPSPLYDFVKYNGGVLFLMISGICAGLSRNSALRGAAVFACGMLISAVTYGMVYLGFAGPDIMISWGVLHLLGFSMLIYPLYKKMSSPCLFLLSAVILLLGYYISGHIRVETPWLFWLGFFRDDYLAADFFPVLPYMGWFMAGSLLGRKLYPEKKTLFPRVNADNPFIRFFSFCGRKSLWIYLAHQPALYLLAILIGKLAGR